VVGLLVAACKCVHDTLPQRQGVKLPVALLEGEEAGEQRNVFKRISTQS
jgi:hypothetical protein